MRHLKKFEALKTSCQTPDANFSIEIGKDSIKCEVKLPFDLDLSEKEAEDLEKNIHNSLETVLAKYFIDKK
jgi:hypothetical protein